MGFAKSTSIIARGDGPQRRRQLLVENLGELAALEVRVDLHGPWGPDSLVYSDRIDRLAAGAAIRLQLPQLRNGEAYKVAVTWTAEGGAAGEFFGVVTAGA
jgi:hypothetical protein